MIGFIILGIFIVLVINIISFSDRFQQEFGRSFIHPEYIILAVLLVLSFIGLGEVFLTILFVTSWGVVAVLGIRDGKKYGFLWTIGMIFYNMVMLVAFWAMISQIKALFSRNKRQ